MESALGLWRRLDTPGHDACRLEQGPVGWKLEGTAVFLQKGAPARLEYLLECDPSWRAERGRVHGWIGPRSVACDFARTPEGVWTLNGARLAGLESCLDLDFGFTPATNLTQLRRLGLRIGDSSDVTVAWLDATAGTLAILPQRY